MDAHAVDHETRLAADDHFALKLWLRMLTCSNLVESRIRQLLRQDYDSTLPRFDLLAQLARADGLKMSELSQRLMVTGGNVTGLADQLESEGWLVREPVEKDRRATRLRLTPEGRDRFSVMARTHEAWIVDLLSPLSRDEQRQLHGLLGKLKLGLHSPVQAEPSMRPRRPPSTGATASTPSAAAPVSPSRGRRAAGAARRAAGSHAVVDPITRFRRSKDRP
jgi:DNA-binding MarR family transcriptional regulator